VRPWLPTFWKMMLMGGRPDSSNNLRMLSYTKQTRCAQCAAAYDGQTYQMA
jgi:hypothetical protein